MARRFGARSAGLTQGISGLGAHVRSMARPRKAKAKRRVGLAVYIEPALLRALRRAADLDRRSASTLAALYIEKGLGIRRGSSG